jgi:hypothetical protein
MVVEDITNVEEVVLEDITDEVSVVVKSLQKW